MYSTADAVFRTRLGQTEKTYGRETIAWFAICRPETVAAVVERGGVHFDPREGQYVSLIGTLGALQWACDLLNTQAPKVIAALQPSGLDGLGPAQETPDVEQAGGVDV